jgi:hypothetical protein
MSVTVGRELEGEFEVQEAIEAVETVRHTAALEVAQVLAELIDDTANADAADSVAAALVACAVAAGDVMAADTLSSKRSQRLGPWRCGRPLGQIAGARPV